MEVVPNGESEYGWKSKKKRDKGKNLSNKRLVPTISEGIIKARDYIIKYFRFS